MVSKELQRKSLPKSSISIPEAHKIDEFIAYDINTTPSTASLLNGIIVPRPIAFITSQGTDGVINAAPFSFFNIVSNHPPVLSLSIKNRKDGSLKDTARNILTIKEFVVNLCSVDLARALSVASDEFPSNISEITVTDLSLLPSEKISVPRVANSLAQMECLLYQVFHIEKGAVHLILGEVVKVHLHHSILNSQGKIDFKKLNPLARLAGLTFGSMDNFFDVPRGL